MKSSFLFISAVLAFTLLPARAENHKALPVNDDTETARVASPAFLNSVTFKITADGEKHVLIVTPGPTQVRIDEPTDRLSVIYNPQTEHYTGLEHSNYTWWEFAWPEVRNEVHSSTRYAARLRDVGPAALDDISGAAAADTNAAPASATAGTDDSGYVWHSTMEKRRIADLDCVRWNGDSLAGESMVVWCATRLVQPVEAAIATLRAINEPMALVPVRNFVPPLVFTAWGAMTKGGVTPVLITWGDKSERNSFALASNKTRDGDMSLFQVPKIYVKTTLVTMDGIGDQKPITGKRDQPVMPRFDSPLP